jgi:hypothetical protein
LDPAIGTDGEPVPGQVLPQPIGLDTVTGVVLPGPNAVQP